MRTATFMGSGKQKLTKNRYPQSDYLDCGYLFFVVVPHYLYILKIYNAIIKKCQESSTESRKEIS